MVGESQEAVGAGVGSASSGQNKMPTLEEYGTNLTRQAEEGKLDPVVVGFPWEPQHGWLGNNMAGHGPFWVRLSACFPPAFGALQS
jgi:hypothetical protein